MLPEIEDLVTNFQTYSDQLTACPICSSERITFCYWSVFFGAKIRYDNCQDCGYIFQNPLLKQAKLVEIYESKWYWGMSNLDTGYINYLKDKDFFQKDYYRRFKKLATLGIPLKGNLLDIGCGAGFSVEVAQRMGFNALGLEPAPAMVKFAQEQLHCSVSCGIFEEFDFEPASYEMVVTWGTANNFRDPIMIYKRAREALTSQGWFATDFFDTASPFSALVSQNFKRTINATGRPSRKSITIALEKAGYHKIQFVHYLPFFSISHILQMSPIRSMRRLLEKTNVGVYVPVWGYYLVLAQKP